MLSGIGVHSGAETSVTVRPGVPGSGISFLRDRKGGRPVRATWGNVTETGLCTVLGDPATDGVATVEHLMAALSAAGVDDALVTVDGPELPILDGSALPFLDAVEASGLAHAEGPRPVIRVLRSVEVECGASHARLDPSPSGFHLDVRIDFAEPAIGRQEARMTLGARAFREGAADCRTFGFLKDVSSLWAAGLALGASLENTVVLAEGAVMNPDGLRRPDEFVRHKLLDAVGDLALAGLPLVGAFRSHRGGHALNHAVLKALFSDARNYAVTGAPVERRRAVTAARR